MATLLLIVVLMLSGLSLYFWARWRKAQRADYIRSYMFPPGLLEKLRTKHPGMTAKDAQLVARALRQFFLAYLKSNFQFVSMPSQVVDDLWHEQILYTRHYDIFCRKAFGRFMHHTPAVVLSKGRRDNAGLRRTWWHACLEENINPRKPTRLPLLFSLDKKLGVPGGFIYAPDCTALRRAGDGSVYCGGDFSSADFDGSIDGFGNAGSSDSGWVGSSDSSSSSSSSGSTGGDAGGDASGDGGGGDSSSCSGGCSGGCGGGD